MAFKILLQKRALLKTLRKRFPSPPRALGPLGNLPYLLKKKKIFGTLADAIQDSLYKYGDPLLIELGTLPILFSKDPDFLRFVMSNDPGAMIRPQMELLVSDSIRNSMLVSDGEKWRKKRKLLRNAFKKVALEEYIPKIHLSVRELGEVWKENSTKNGGKNVDVLLYYNRLTNDVIGRVGFSFDFQSQQNPNNVYANAVNTFLEITHLQYNNPLYQLMGLYLFKHITPLGRKFMKSLAIIKRMLTDVVAPRLNPNSLKKNDILQHILESTGMEHTEYDEEELLTLTQEQVSRGQEKFYDKKQFTIQELVNEVLVFFIAGHESTSNLLAWTTYHLAKYPYVKEKIIEELKQNNLFNIDDETPPKFSTLNNLTYLNAVLKETLRLYPAIAFIGREAGQEIQYKNFIIPEGTTLFPHIYSIQRDPQHWKIPTNEFNPDRFLPESAKGRDPYAWAPFSAGARNCIGMQFAMMEARLVLAYLIPRFDFVDTTNPKLIEKLLFTSENLRMTVKLREV